MTKINSTAPARARKPRKPKPPKKPHKDFPLFPSGNGLWCKKVLKKLHYFGSWRDDPKGEKALERWLEEKDDLFAGRVPRRKADGQIGPTLAKLLLDFLTTKKMLLDGGELSPYTFKAYRDVCAELEATFNRDRLLTDIEPEDFQKLRERWAAKWGAERLATEINRARIVFNFAYRNKLVDRPFQYGEGFKRPSKKVRRLNKAAAGAKMFEADELRRMIDGATQPMKAMLLLAANGGLGNNDIGQMPLSAIDLAAGWLNYPRPKTGISRRVPLWPETVAALREWLGCRPSPKDEADAGLVFLTVRGDGWAKNISDRPITHECRKLLDKLKINGKRNFYAIRHSFETIGGASRDQPAVDAIMGHDDGSMASNYRERVDDDRLKAVVQFVHAWLFAKVEGGAA